MERLSKTLLIHLLSEYLFHDCSAYYTYEGFNNEGRQIPTSAGLVQDTSIEIYAFPKNEPKKGLPILRVNIFDDPPQVHIPNIIMPPLLQHKGVGKKLIRLIYEVGALHGYHTFVVDLTEGFRTRLLKRGALETNTYDALQIVESTKLM